MPRYLTNIWSPLNSTRNFHNTNFPKLSKFDFDHAVLYKQTNWKHFKKWKFFILNSILENLIFKRKTKRSLLMRAGDVEINPGPPPPTLKIITYNCRGLKDRNILKRVLNSCHKIINANRNSVINLQETHLDDSDKSTLDVMWRHRYVISPGTARRCGTLTLFDPSWDFVMEESDNEGRCITVVLKKLDLTFIFTNIYAPNNQNHIFYQNIYRRLVNLKSIYDTAKIILAGDFNIVISETDSVNRATSQNERQCREAILQGNLQLNLVDSYRVENPEGGFTWYRGNCMSRLDMVFVLEDLTNNGVKANLDWSFDNSDHAMLEIAIKIKCKMQKGPGLLRVNCDLLENQVTSSQVEAEIEQQLKYIPAHWDPHSTLDFAKVVIRSVFSEFTGKIKKFENHDKEAIEEQLNALRNVKEKLEIGEISNPALLTEVDRTIITLEQELNVHLDKLSRHLALRSRAKWFEKGERSNSYFLNLTKQRTEQLLIKSLTSESGQATNQKDIMAKTVEFYKKLYDRKDTQENYDDLLSGLPQLSDSDREGLDREITLEELRRTVNGCGDSAPGPDGIPYAVYRRYWRLLGPILLNSWKYSIHKGILPLDQRLSTITLLPKSGKDLEKIENWRPITLTNCDLKIFTKCISNRVSKVLDKLIHPTQTAYIPGRVVHDNLRMFDFYNNYCKEKNIDAVLISLDAKKAFDSVSHKYMHKVLASYGFSDEFIATVNLLYNDIKANILVNGYKSTIIDILRSVKQGDALSCALFILCIDPLLRKIESNPSIKPIPIPRTRYSNNPVNNKVGAFADDVGAAVKNDPETIQAIFNDYDLFSKLSGIELNVGKTEVLKLNDNTTHADFIPTQFILNGQSIFSSESIKICGITFSSNTSKAYDSNVNEKILKMEKQLIMWLPRCLSIEGKILIVKTFGLRN